MPPAVPRHNQEYTTPTMSGFEYNDAISGSSQQPMDIDQGLQFNLLQTDVYPETPQNMPMAQPATAYDQQFEHNPQCAITGQQPMPHGAINGQQPMPHGQQPAFGNMHPQHGMNSQQQAFFHAGMYSQQQIPFPADFDMNTALAEIHPQLPMTAQQGIGSQPGCFPQQVVPDYPMPFQPGMQNHHQLPMTAQQGIGSQPGCFPQQVVPDHPMPFQPGMQNHPQFSQHVPQQQPQPQQSYYTGQSPSASMPTGTYQAATAPMTQGAYSAPSPVDGSQRRCARSSSNILFQQRFRGASADQLKHEKDMVLIYGKELAWQLNMSPPAKRRCMTELSNVVAWLNKEIPRRRSREIARRYANTSSAAATIPAPSPSPVPRPHIAVQPPQVASDGRILYPLPSAPASAPASVQVSHVEAHTSSQATVFEEQDLQLVEPAPAQVSHVTVYPPQAAFDEQSPTSYGGDSGYASVGASSPEELKAQDNHQDQPEGETATDDMKEERAIVEFVSKFIDPQQLSTSSNIAAPAPTAAELDAPTDETPSAFNAYAANADATLSGSVTWDDIAEMSPYSFPFRN